jgi:GDP-L-fucose synthase
MTKKSPNKNRSNLLVTGGSGFIGHNLIEYFTTLGYRVLAPRHKELDLADQQALNKYFNRHKIDFVIHCAVKPYHRAAIDQSAILLTNLRMFFNLAENQHKYKKMIVLGSGSAYNAEKYKPKMREEYLGKFIPNDEGGLAKYIISKYIEKSDKIYDLRVFGIFGKYEDYSIRFISNLICKAIYNLPLTMNQNRRFSYIDVDDFCRIAELFLKNDFKYHAYNITPDESLELSDLAEMIKKISGKNLEIRVKDEGMGPEYTGNNKRLRAELPDFKFSGIDQSVQKLYKWYIEHKGDIDKNLLIIDK